MTVEIGSRGDYAHVVLRGTLATAEDVNQVTSLLRRAMNEAAIRRFLVSGRELDRQPPKEAWSALWSWLGERTCRQLAWVVPPGTGELTITTLNMAAMTDAIPFRAFPMVLDAARWLELRSTGGGGSRRPSHADLLEAGDSGERPTSSRRVSWAELAAAEEEPSSSRGGEAGVARASRSEPNRKK